MPPQHSEDMTKASRQSSVLQQLLGLHEIDQKILTAERELQRCEDALTAAEESVTELEAGLEKVDAELERVRGEARSGEQAAEERRDTLNRLRTRVNQVQNERQYSAASLEFDLVKQDLRTMEDRLLEKMQVVEEMENRRAELKKALEEARAAAGPQREEAESKRKQLEDELAVHRDRRQNLAIRLEARALALYDRIRMGRSEVALAPLTEEGVCGHCYTAVTVQQEMQIKGMSHLICCEGCGVILYPESLTG